MTEQTAIIGASNGKSVAIDLDRLIGGHIAIIANSGGGKSGLIRKLAEVTAGSVQQIFLDPEDEFYTLRERHDYVIAGGDDGDIPVSVEGAKALALATLQHGFSLIVQLNDLGPQADAFVAAFLNAMIHAPRDLWHPALVIIDEAQRFAPSGGTETPAARAVKALTAQGRKRGFTAVLASQRIAKIDANVRGDINNWMLGRVGQALDRNAMADQLGFSAREGRERLAGIADRHFWGFGPAVAAEPVLFRVSDVETTPVRPGQAKVLTPPPAGALADILAGLAAEAPKGEASADAAPVGQIEHDEINGLRERVRRVEADNLALEQERDALRRTNDIISGQIFAIRDVLAVNEAHKLAPVPTSPTPRRAPEIEKPAAAPKPARAAPADGGITGPQQRILDALAWWATLGKHTVTNEQAAFIAGYAPNSGGFNNPRGALKMMGHVSYPVPGTVALTGTGAALATTPAAPANGVHLRQMVSAKLNGPQRRIFEVVVAAYPESLTNEDAAQLAGYAPNAGGYNNPRGSLKMMTVLTYPHPGHVRASDWLFP